MRDQEREAKKRQTFFQTSGKFTETTQLTEDLDVMGTMRSKVAAVIEPIKERSSNAGS